MFTRQDSLIQKFKVGVEKLPRVKLANLPTPLEKATILTKELGGPEIYFKRDDLTGLMLSGNKTRMFEFHLAKALNDGYDTIIAGAGVQSNYCRQLSAACCKLNLKLHLILKKIRGNIDLKVQGNLFLDLLFGARVEIVDVSWEELFNILKLKAKEISQKGYKPYIPQIFDLHLDVISYANCFLELYKQLQERSLKIDYLFLTSNGCTSAGLILGKKIVGMKELQIISVDPGGQNKDRSVYISDLANEASSKLKLGVRIRPSEVVCLSDYIGEGYGKPTRDCIDAIQRVVKSEGILLDPIYSGKGMACLINLIQRGKLKRGHRVVFLHTGGWPALFAYTDDFDFTSTFLTENYI